MRGPKSLNHSEGHEGALKTMMNSEMSREQIGSLTARAHDLRAQHIGKWGRRVAATWAGLFRLRPHLLPTHTDTRDRVVHSAML